MAASSAGGSGGLTATSVRAPSYAAAVADEGSSDGSEAGDTVAPSLPRGEGGAGTEAAVAATGDSEQPKVQKLKRSWQKELRVERTEALPDEQRVLVTKFEEETCGDVAGRIGFYVANFGASAKKKNRHAQT